MPRKLAAAVRMRKPKPSLYLSGKDARPLSSAKIGQTVNAMVRGKVTSMGINTYEPGKPLNVTMEVHRMTMGKKL